jgi:hypothetical protein
MKDIIKSLKDLGLEIVNSDSTATKDWLKTTAKLYEQLLLTDYLEKRNASLNAIEDELVERIGQVTASTPIEIKQPEATSPVIESLGQEIREVPIPQGPPVSNIQESIYEEPEPLIEKKIEEVTFETSFEDAPASSKPKIANAAKTEAEDLKVSIAEKAATKPKKSLNDSLSGSSLKFGLNDRIAFVKHLFNGSQEDFNRVVSQLNTFTNQQEALDFVEHIVKPEYNWKSKEDFAERFMESLENRFA